MKGGGGEKHGGEEWYVWWRVNGARESDEEARGIESRGMGVGWKGYGYVRGTGVGKR